MGGNPHASGGSLMAKPDVLQEIEAIRARGGKVVVVDPRRTKTADVSDEWIGIQPGTDAAWLLAIVQVLFEEDLIELGHVAGMVADVDELRDACAPFTPEAVAALTRIPPETTRRIAHEIAAAQAASIYGRIGLCNQEFGTLASWLIDVLAIVSGNFDRPGTLMFSNPVPFPLAWMASTKANGLPSFGRWSSRVRGAPEVLGQVPASCLAEEIVTPGPGQIKGPSSTSPAIRSSRWPDSARLEEALPQPRVHDRDRQLPQRDNAPRPRAAPRSVAAGDATLRRHAVGIRGALRRQVAATPSFRSIARTSGRS